MTRHRYSRLLPFAPHAIDFYKTGHGDQAEPGTNFIYSNFTPRSGRRFAEANQLTDWDGQFVFFGLKSSCERILEDLWEMTFFDRPKDEVLERIRHRMDGSLGPGAIKIDRFAALHDLGYLPVSIYALPEGSLVPCGVPPFTVENTHGDFSWITNFLETQISNENWKPITTATTAREFRKLIDRWAVATGSDRNFVLWQGHDFSARGLSGVFDAYSSAPGHLLSFTGTDTVSAIDLIELIYTPADSATMIGGSIPATEHSIMSLGGKEHELDTYRRLMTVVYPKGFLSIVSDTWDFFKIITAGVTALKDAIMSRDGRVVFRPDSGDPFKILVGDDNATPGSPQYKGAVQCLWEVFGGTETGAGYKLLDTHVGLIYGDSITIPLAGRIFAGLAAKGFASGNVVLGIGSFTYQMVTRDTLGTAIKATYAEVNGEPRLLFKDPLTDDGTKKSARGLLKVVRGASGRYELIDGATRHPDQPFDHGELKEVWATGRYVGPDLPLEDLRRRALGEVV